MARTRFVPRKNPPESGEGGDFVEISNWYLFDFFFGFKMHEQIPTNFQTISYHILKKNTAAIKKTSQII